MPISNQSDFFLNFQQFGDLKLLARKQSDDAAEQVAQQFEGLFVQQMLDAMRAAAKIDTGQHSSYMDFYQEMYDKQLAQMIAKQDRLGVSRMILRQLPPAAADIDNEPENLVFTAPRTESVSKAAIPKSIPAAQPIIDASSAEVVVSKVLDDDFAEVGLAEQSNAHWQNPADFVFDIWPRAEAAARQLGTSVGVLVAQAALETGWGKHTLKHDDGRSSYNLFGIKAGPEWQGDVLTRNSLEYRDGLLRNEVSKFRAYATATQSLNDYVDFIRTNPRYQHAVAQAGNDQAYIKEIHNAGYATDPDYANKVLEILNGELIQNSLASLRPGVIDHA